MHASPSLFWSLPFALLLGCIALFPLLRPHWWEKNFQWVSLVLGLTVAAYYLLGRHDMHSLAHTTAEYVSFIALVGSLYVVAGGIHIQVKGEATPLANCVFLAVGSVVANLLGTTGASMVLIRPWMRMNKYRLTTHHIIFFIFLVSNIGGGLTPIGDPPLFLGYLKGVPFFWVIENVWRPWLVAISLLLAVFYWLDLRNFKKAPAAVRSKETAQGETWKFSGGINVFLIAVIIASVFVTDPPFLREGIMLAAAVLSYRLTPRSIHQQNDFGFGPIREVAILFAGIFATMIPALQWLEHHAASLGISQPGQIYWASGTLSAVLDNAPTYLNFLSVILGLYAPADLSEHARIAHLLVDYPQHIRSISVATVYFGAMTYIGNGPNFLVRSIADQAKVKMPTFFGYCLRYSFPVLLPVLALVWFCFFR